MARQPPRPELSLKGLDLFLICARKGALQAVAQEAGLSVSTVSHHLRQLEQHLGVALFDHDRRPLVLTPRGQVFLRRIEPAVMAIRKARAEAMSGSLAEASHLRLGTIEDLDSDIVPELAVYLSRRMPACDFTYHSDVSHQILHMLRDRQLDLGITASPSERFRDLQDRPLLRDPFVVVLPLGTEQPVAEIVQGRSKLPFLRFSGALIIAQQIEAQLRRLGVDSPHRFECGNNQTLMAMVAAGAGWTITTPLLFARARRFHPQLRMHQFPGKAFARTLVLAATPDCSAAILDLVDAELRRLLTRHAVAPFHASTPWLKDMFTLID